VAIWSIFSLAECLCRNFLLTSIYWHWFRWIYFCKFETRSKIHQVAKSWLKLALKKFLLLQFIMSICTTVYKI